MRYGLVGSRKSWCRAVREPEPGQGVRAPTLVWLTSREPSPNHRMKGSPSPRP